MVFSLMPTVLLNAPEDFNTGVHLDVSELTPFKTGMIIDFTELYVLILV